MRADWHGRFSGQLVAVLCSGPSMCAEDAAAVSHLPRVVTNTTFRLAPDANFLFGFDFAWWQRYIDEVRASFKGELVSHHSTAAKFGCTPMDRDPEFRIFGNSGASAVAFAALLGARRVLLLGADCSVAGGTHWHGDHPPELANARGAAVWPRHFASAAGFARWRRTEVINCSRKTALTCFPRATLEEVLCTTPA